LPFKAEEGTILMIHSYHTSNVIIKDRMTTATTYNSGEATNYNFKAIKHNYNSI